MIHKNECIYSHGSTESSDSFALRDSKAECNGCGTIADCWVIDSSSWEYAGIALCKRCLTEMTGMLNESSDCEPAAAAAAGKWRPWTIDEVPLGIGVEKISGRIKCAIGTVYPHNGKVMLVGYGFMTSQDLFECWQQLDGTPCGKEKTK